MWVKLDDSFFENRKVVRLSARAKLLFLAGLTHAAKHLTDGYLLDADVRIIRVFAEASSKHVQELINASLWERAVGGYSIHDWSDYNPPAEKVRAERAAAKERMRRARSGEQPANVQDEVRGEVPPPPVSRTPPTPPGEGEGISGSCASADDLPLPLLPVYGEGT